MKRRFISLPSLAAENAERKKSLIIIEDHLIPNIFPHVTLCDVRFVAEATLVKSIIEFGLNIKECCVRKHSVDSSQSFYRKYVGSTAILRLQGINETDARKIIKNFTAVKDLTIRNMDIYFEDLPVNLSRIAITDCRIKNGSTGMEIWMRNSSEDLTHLHLENLVFSRSPIGIIYLSVFKILTNITLIGLRSSLFINCPTVKFMHLTYAELNNEYINCPNLTHLHFDVPCTPAQFNNVFGHAKSLEKITARSWIDPKYLKQFTLLNHLEILSALPTWIKPKAQKLTIKEVKVHFEPTAADPGLIFDLLNEYCLLEIISYLPARDWMQFALLHPKAECAVVSYKYPRAKLTMKDIPKGAFQDIAPFVRNFEIGFNQRDDLIQLSSIKSLELKSIDFSQKWLRVLPTRLEKLSMHKCSGLRVDFSPYFHELRSTLQVLEIDQSWSLNQESLFKLRNLRELKLDWIESVEYLATILEHNMETLERVEIRLSGLGYCGSVLKLIQKMSKLKSLGIAGFSKDCGETEMKDMFMDIGPQLRKLSVDVDQEIMIDIFASGNFNHLEELEARFSTSYDDRYICGLMSLTTLQRLSVIDNLPWHMILEINIRAPLLAELVIALPRLSEIIVPYFIRAIISMALRQFLKQAKRTLRIRSDLSNEYEDVK